MSQAVRRRASAESEPGNAHVGIVIFIAVFFIGLRDDAARLFLQFARRKHQGVLIARPILIGREAKPLGGAVLVNWFSRDGWWPDVGKGPIAQSVFRFRGSTVIAISLQVISEVPSDVGECAEARHGVADKTLLVLAARGGMDSVVVHVQDQRDDHVLSRAYAACGQTSASKARGSASNRNRVVNIVALSAGQGAMKTVKLSPFITGSP